MSSFSSPEIPRPPEAGLDLQAEAVLAPTSLRSLYDQVLGLTQRYLSISEVSVLGVRTLRNAHLDLPAHELTSLDNLPLAESAGPALLYHAALLQLLANQLGKSSSLLGLALERATHREDRTRLLLETARIHLESAKWDEALTVYRQLADHDEQSFPLPAEQYELESVIGAGGFSTVFLCREKESGTSVVVKSMDLTKELAQQIDAFHEADMLRLVQHPGVVKLLRNGFADSANRRNPFVVLEYLPGQTLHDYVSRYGPFSWQNWLPIARQTLAALQAVHDAGVVHRDVKPSNLILNFDSAGWHVKLIDFGIAIRRPMPAGTYGFAAPEQLKHTPEFSTSVDVYAFGRTTCYALTGKPDLKAEHTASLPGKLVGLLEACQSQTASERPSLADLINVLDRLLESGKSTPKKPVPPSPASAAPIKSSPTDLIPPEPAPKTWRYEEANDSLVSPEKNTLRALVIEPDPQHRMCLGDLLKQLKYDAVETRSCASGTKALKDAISEGRPFSIVFVSSQIHTFRPIDMVSAVRSSHHQAKIVLVLWPPGRDEQYYVDLPQMKNYGVEELLAPVTLKDLRKLLEPEQRESDYACPSMMPEVAESPHPGAAPITTTIGPTPEREKPTAIPPLPPPASTAGTPRKTEVPSRPSSQNSPYQSPPKVPPIPQQAPRSRPDLPDSVASAPGPATSAPQNDLKDTLVKTWDSVTQKISDWFTSKPSSERMESKGNLPLEDWAKPLSPGSGKVPSRFPNHEPERDVVDCTVFAPPEIEAGDTIMIQAMLHLPEQSQMAAAMAKLFDQTATARGTRSLDTTIERGTKVAFQLTVPGLDIDDAMPPPIVWRGSTEGVQFGVTAPSSFPQKTVIGTMLVMMDGVPIGQIKFKLSVKAAQASEIPAAMPSVHAATPQPHKMSRYRMVFISYASADRDEVLKRVQMLKRFDIKFFQDVLNLEPGERWEQSLYKHIDESDLFLLFWSTAAKNSKWVQEEVKYALSLRSKHETELPEILPIVLEGPPVPTPHPELSHLHFNDQILHFVADRYSSSAS